MLRAVHDVLRPGGIIAGYVIHTPGGLAAVDQQLANELGPSEVGADEAPTELLARAGFDRIESTDVTGPLHATATALRRVRREHEEALRREEGAAVFEEDQAKFGRMTEGIERGLLLRSLVVGTRSG